MSDVITKQRIAELIYSVMTELKVSGGRAHPNELFARVKAKTSLSSYELEPNKTSGVPRWEIQVRWYTTDLVRAGFLTKHNGPWQLTPEGEQMLVKSSPLEFFTTARKRYSEWKKSRDNFELIESPPDISSQPDVSLFVDIEKTRERAHKSIEDHINQLGWIEFQELVAELLKAMGYHISHIAPKGPDGGVDIYAYSDPLGLQKPHIKVQVKHRDNKVGISDIRELHGLLRDSDEIGLFVSSGGFSRNVSEETRKMTKHIELMSLERFIELWKEYYDKVSDTGKQLLPLISIYFLKPESANN